MVFAIWNENDLHPEDFVSMCLNADYKHEVSEILTSQHKCFRMKKSIFNSSISIDNRHTLLYNSFSGRFITVKDRVFDIDSLTTDELRIKHPILCNQMLEAGMLVADNMNELEELEKRIMDGDDNSEEFILHVNPTLDCNFNCWYCYENHVSGSRMSDTVISSIEKLILTILRKPEIKSFQLCFFGGEPLMHFKESAMRLIDYTSNLCKGLNKNLSIQFTSNGSLISKSIIEYLSQFDCSFQITLDGHREVHDKTRYFKNGKGSYDTIVGNIQRLCNSGIDVIARINYTAENINSVFNILNDFDAINENARTRLRFDFQRIWQERTNRVDESELLMKSIRERFRQVGFSVSANHIPHDVGQSCYGDKVNHALINYNGDVFGCTARDFSQRNRIGVLDQDGVIRYDEHKLSRRNNAKLHKKVCRKCRIAPICGGGCKQVAFESMDNDRCTMGYNEIDINGIITDIFEYSYGLITG